MRYQIVNTWNGGKGGREVVFTSYLRDTDGKNECFEWILKNTPFSYSEAITNQGYELVEIGDRKPFTDEEKRRQRSIAHHEMYTHSYQHRGSDPDNCAACALSLRPTPNYAGWPTLYMAGNRTIPAKAFTRELKHAPENPRYYENLLDYMYNFGAEIDGRKEAKHG